MFIISGVQRATTFLIPIGDLGRDWADLTEVKLPGVGEKALDAFGYIGVVQGVKRVGEHALQGLQAVKTQQWGTLTQIALSSVNTIAGHAVFIASKWQNVPRHSFPTLKLVRRLSGTCLRIEMIRYVVKDALNNDMRNLPRAGWQHKLFFALNGGHLLMSVATILRPTNKTVALGELALRALGWGFHKVVLFIG